MELQIEYCYYILIKSNTLMMIICRVYIRTTGPIGDDPLRRVTTCTQKKK